MKAIVAINKRGYIGLNGALPWKKCKADLKHFKEMTKGTVCIVGRKTVTKLPPLSGRQLFVIGSDFWTVRDAVKITNPNAWVIGGMQTYETLLPYCDELHISIIEDETVGDVMAPDLSDYKGKIFVYYFKP